MTVVLSANLKALRGKRTQDEVARELNISRAAYSHYENNRNEPDLDMLILLADYYNVTIDFLLGRNTNMRDEVSLINSLVEQSQLQQKRIRELETTIIAVNSVIAKDVQSVLSHALNPKN